MDEFIDLIIGITIMVVILLMTGCVVKAKELEAEVQKEVIKVASEAVGATERVMTIWLGGASNGRE